MGLKIAACFWPPIWGAKIVNPQLVDKNAPPDVRPKTGPRFGGHLMAMITVGETYTCHMALPQQTQAKLHIFRILQGAVLPPKRSLRTFSTIQLALGCL